MGDAGAQADAQAEAEADADADSAGRRTDRSGLDDHDTAQSFYGGERIVRLSSSPPASSLLVVAHRKQIAHPNP